MYDKTSLSGIKACFCPIASGSSGNCTFIATGSTQILIDAGVSGKEIEAGLKDIGTEGSLIDACFVTHEHLDHIKGIGILSRRFDIPIYATEGTWRGMEGIIGEIARKNRRIIYADEKLALNDMIINPFSISHDANEPVGYSVISNDYKMTVATDLGCYDDSLKQNVSDSDILLLEANHDIEMLKKGPYPFYLKKRILGDKGHMSNDTAGKLLCEIMSEKMKYVFLGHLSDKNNLPSLAHKTVESILYDNKIKLGKDLNFLEMANRHGISSIVKV